MHPTTTPLRRRYAGIHGYATPQPPRHQKADNRQRQVTGRERSEMKILTAGQLSMGGGSTRGHAGGPQPGNGNGRTAGTAAASGYEGGLQQKQHSPAANRHLPTHLSGPGLSRHGQQQRSGAISVANHGHSMQASLPVRWCHGDFRSLPWNRATVTITAASKPRPDRPPLSYRLFSSGSCVVRPVPVATITR